jgi:cystathionine beta-lyase
MEKTHRQATRLIHAGNDPKSQSGAVNPPVYHASTVLSPNYAAYESRLEAPFVYGRSGTPTTKALGRALADLEGAEDAILTPSGVAAIALVLSAYSSPGAEILISDAAYPPVRKFCDGPLKQQGAVARYYDPLDLGTLEDQIGPQTALIWMESPASQTFEVQDIPATVAIAKRHGIPTATDNTWAAGYFLQPLSLGADISVQALTKYVGGHSDLMMGAVMASGEPFKRVKTHSSRYGFCVAGDDAYLALRGLRTLAVRLDRHQQNAAQVADFLASHPKVDRILYPARAGDAGHEIWKRDFSGASGLFGFVVKQELPVALPKFFDGLRLLAMGGSWGGYESLLIPTWPQRQRSCTTWAPNGQTMRIHVGLEDAADIIADLDAALARWG